ncbi:hypothetical protein B0T18DRAFT_386314 [Schizothecium vesticola]|uniref:Uncharacterized protein n=1 Tax=Schizothecium vesticola TaxID=314040 RepID=A0AA40FB56_9PEZI|nr:hypothetical protein B0T18DRAFT_386314 [Schizothecium vesticola]
MTREGLNGRGMTLANLILPQTHIFRGYYSEGLAGSRGVDYYSYVRLLEQKIGGISFEQIESYFPLWQTVDAMKLDTSRALHEGNVAYDVSEHPKDGQQIKYPGRLYLELARKSPRQSGILPEFWRAKTLAYPEVNTLQSPYDDPVDGVHRGGSVIVRISWPTQKIQGPYLQLDHVEKVFHGISSALHVLLIKHNRVTFKNSSSIEIPPSFSRWPHHPAAKPSALTFSQANSQPRDSDNKREWARFCEMLLSISPTTRPDYMAKVEEYLDRPFNQDIFADCTNEVEDQLKEQLAESEAAAKRPPPVEWLILQFGNKFAPESEEDPSKAAGEEDEAEEQLDDTEGEEGPEDEFEVVAREEAVTAQVTSMYGL